MKKFLKYGSGIAFYASVGFGVAAIWGLDARFMWTAIVLTVVLMLIELGMD